MPPRPPLGAHNYLATDGMAESGFDFERFLIHEPAELFKKLRFFHLTIIAINGCLK